MPEETSPDGRVGLCHEEFNLILDKVIKNETGIKSATCEYDYYYDFNSGEGLAHLASVDGRRLFLSPCIQQASRAGLHRSRTRLASALVERIYWVTKHEAIYLRSPASVSEYQTRVFSNDLRMAEAFGIVSGAIGVAAAFTACVDCFNYVQLGRHIGRDF